MPDRPFPAVDNLIRHAQRVAAGRPDPARILAQTIRATGQSVEWTVDLKMAKGRKVSRRSSLCQPMRLPFGHTLENHQHPERDHLGFDPDDDHRLTSPAYDQGIGFLVVLLVHRARSSSRMRPPHLGYHVCILVLPRSEPRLPSRSGDESSVRIDHPRKMLRREAPICSPAENLMFG